MSGRTILCTAFALVAFAANSILCRLALGGAAIDAASFASIRLASGAAALLGLITITRPRPFQLAGGWASGGLLLLYAVPFSFAYTRLGAATGALALFGAVQMTMIAAALRSGERPHLWQWAGLFVALAGLVYLVLPGLKAPSPRGSVLMAVAGIAWGVYSLRGLRAADPLAETAGNFVRSVPLVVAINVAALGLLHVTPYGALLAMLSGAVASGLGYAIWYMALRGLTSTRAATVQLLVPVLAALGGVIILREDVSLRLLVAAVMILGGVWLTLMGRQS